MFHIETACIYVTMQSYINEYVWDYTYIYVCVCK